MSNVYLSATVSEDGSLTIPAFAVRGLGYGPEEEVNMTLPVRQYLCDCDDNELFIDRCCGDIDCAGYRSDGGELNIPARVLAEAELPVGTDISILIAEGALLLVAAGEELEELPSELCGLLSELGVSPLTVVKAGDCCLCHGDDGSE